MNLDIQTPAWAESLLVPARYIGVYGGRGSGKSHERGEAMVERHIMEPNTASVCLRETQKSIKLSVKRLVEQKIQKFGAGDHFDIQDQLIKNRRGDGMIIFQGMQNHTAESIKSLEGFDIAWFEEAQSASQRSLDLLRPTIRKDNSELWFTWNPDEPTDPIDMLLRGEHPPPRSVVKEVNFMDNPWFPDVLREEMEYDRGRDKDKYNHVWLGKYKKNSKARVFNNWRIEEFDSPANGIYRQGADWGFSVDPSVLIRARIEGRTLYIDYEAYRVGCEIVDTPDLFMTIPDSEKWPLTADSSRPETISHMRKNGFPKIVKAVKGAGSLEDGIEWLKSFDIVVHPRCVHTIDELSSYKWMVDPLTDAILPILVDKKNHVIDALRYACEGARRAQGTKRAPSKPALPVHNRW